MKYYPIKCRYCSGLFYGFEPKDDFVCEDCVKDAHEVATHYQCPDCKKVFSIGMPHDKQYRCRKCRAARANNRATLRRARKEWEMAERYRIKMFGKDGGVKCPKP